MIITSQYLRFRCSVFRLSALGLCLFCISSPACFSSSADGECSAEKVDPEVLRCDKPQVSNTCEWQQFNAHYEKECAGKPLKGIRIEGQSMGSWGNVSLGGALGGLTVLGDVVIKNTSLQHLARLDLDPKSPSYGQCIEGLCGLKHIGEDGALQIIGNKKLVRADQLKGLITLEGDLRVENNPKLLRLGGFRQPESREFWDIHLNNSGNLGALHVLNNPKLKSIVLPGVKKITATYADLQKVNEHDLGDIVLRDNVGLEEFSLPDLILVRNDMRYFNNGLRRLEFMDNFEFFTLEISSARLEEIVMPNYGCQPPLGYQVPDPPDGRHSCFSNVHNKGDILLHDNPDLKRFSFATNPDLDGFDVWGTFRVENNPQLKVLDLAKVKKIRTLRVKKNKALEVIRAPTLVALADYWGGRVSIVQNSRLQELSMPQLQQIGHSNRPASFHIDLTSSDKALVALGTGLKPPARLLVHGDFLVQTSKRAKVMLPSLYSVGQNRPGLAHRGKLDITWEAVSRGGGLGQLYFVSGEFMTKGWRANLTPRLAFVGKFHSPAGSIPTNIKEKPFKVVVQSVCGNGVVEPGEECDAGSKHSSQCSPECRLTRCGDGIFQKEKTGFYRLPEFCEGPHPDNPKGVSCDEGGLAYAGVRKYGWHCYAKMCECFPPPSYRVPFAN